MLFISIFIYTQKRWWLCRYARKNSKGTRKYTINLQVIRKTFLCSDRLQCFILNLENVIKIRLLLIDKFVLVITDLRLLEFMIRKTELSVQLFSTHIQMFLQYLLAAGRSGFIMCTA